MLGAAKNAVKSVIKRPVNDNVSSDVGSRRDENVVTDRDTYKKEN